MCLSARKKETLELAKKIKRHGGTITCYKVYQQTDGLYPPIFYGSKPVVTSKELLTKSQIVKTIVSNSERKGKGRRGRGGATLSQSS